MLFTSVWRLTDIADTLLLVAFPETQECQQVEGVIATLNSTSPVRGSGQVLAHNFHYIIDRGAGLCYVTLASAGYPPPLAFSFLEDLRKALQEWGRQHEDTNLTELVLDAVTQEKFRWFSEVMREIELTYQDPWTDENQLRMEVENEHDSMRMEVENEHDAMAVDVQEEHDAMAVDVQEESEQLLSEEMRSELRDMYHLLMTDQISQQAHQRLAQLAAEARVVDIGEASQAFDRALSDVLPKDPPIDFQDYWRLANVIPTESRIGADRSTFAELQGRTGRRPFRTTHKAERALKLMFKGLDGEMRDLGERSAEIFQRVNKPATPTAPKRESKWRKPMNSQHAYSVLETALVADGASPDEARSILQPFISAVGTMGTTPDGLFDSAQQLSVELFGKKFSNVHAAVGFKDYVPGLEYTCLGGVVCHFPTNKKHFAGHTSPEFEDITRGNPPLWHNYYADEPDSQYEVDPVCCSFHFMGNRVKGSHWEDVITTDIYPIPNHPRKGGISPSSEKDMMLAAEVLNCLLRAGVRWLRVFSYIGTIAILALLESAQRPSGKAYDIEVTVYDTVVRVHIFTEVEVPVPGMECIVVSVGLIGSNHVSLLRIWFHVRKMVAADSLFSGLIGKELNQTDFEVGLKVAQGEAFGGSEESVNFWLQEEHEVIRAFVITLVRKYNFPVEAAFQAVTARRRVGNGLRMLTEAKASAAAQKLMQMPGKPKTLFFEAKGIDVVARSMKLKNLTNREEEQQRYPVAGAGGNADAEGESSIWCKKLRREDQSFATAVFTNMEAEGVSMSDSNRSSKVTSREEAEAIAQSHAALVAARQAETPAQAVARKALDKEILLRNLKQRAAEKP